MKKTARILCLTIVISMLFGMIPAYAKSSKSTDIDNYLSASFDVYNVPIVNSLVEFKELMADGQIKPCIEDKTEAINTYSIKAKQNGCLVVSNSTFMALLESSTKNVQVIKAGLFDKLEEGVRLIPMRKGDAFSLQTTKSPLTVYIGFIPENKIFNIDESSKNANGTLQFKFGNIYENNTVMSVYATKKVYKTQEILTNDLLSYNKTISYDYTSISDDQDAVLTLPNGGEYTLTIKVFMNNTVISAATVILDTDKYIVPTLDKLEKPIAAIAGTNLIVGMAEPASVIYAEYNDIKYSGKTDRYGIYRIVLEEDMKEGKLIRIWQTKSKLTSKKAKYRVLPNE